MNASEKESQDLYAAKLNQILARLDSMQGSAKKVMLGYVRTSSTAEDAESAQRINK